MYLSFPYIIKTTSILFILLAYYKLFLRKQTFFRLNRLYLISSLLIAIVTPFISIKISAYVSVTENIHPMKAYMSNLLDEVYVFGNYVPESIPVKETNFNYLLFMYWLGVSLLILRYLFALFQILQLKYRYPHKHFHGINVIILPEGQAAFSFFNNLFIPVQLNREDRHKVFEHEKIHIRQLHSMDLFIAEIICISNWFNPLVWIFKSIISQNHEYIADRQVIRRFHTGSYLELLIRQTFKGAFSFTNYFSCSNLKKRTIMMTKKQSHQYLVFTFIPITAILITILYSFTCNPIDPRTPNPQITESSGSSFLIPAMPAIKRDSSAIFQVVEQMPEFPGNINQWIAKNVKYPTIAIENGIQGKVYVRFIIEKDGSITNIKIQKGIDPSLDKEALRVVKTMPTWKPGKQRGQVVRVAYTLPIYFALSQPVNTDEKLDKMPIFSQGSINKWISENLQYPENALKNGIKGKVYVKFVIEKNGSITNVQVAKGINKELDEEALCLVKSMPAWTPAAKDGQPVKTSYTLPITFSIM